MGDCSFNRNGLNDDLKDELLDLFDTMIGENSELNRKTILINSLADIGESYTTSSLSDLADFIDEFAMQEAPELRDSIPSNITVYLQDNASNIDTIVEEDLTKLDSLDNPEEAEASKHRVRNFIKINYGTATEVSSAMESDLTDNIVKYFMLNRETGRVVKTTNGFGEINEGLRTYQESLLQNVISYLKDVYSKSGSNTETLETLSRMTMYKDGVYTNAVSTINTLGERFLHHSHFSADDLRKSFYRDRLLDKKFIKAYNSLITLNYFDDLLKSKLKDVLSINENYPMYSTEDRYSIEGTGAQNARSWGDKDINMNDQVSNIDILIIETTPMYSWGNTTPSESRRVKLDAFNYIISKVKSLVNSSDIQNPSLTFDSLFFLKYPHLSYLQNFLQGKSLYNLLTTVSTGDALRNYNALFELICDSQFFNNNQSIFKGFKSIEKDLIYSLKQEMFGNSKNSLFDIYKNDIIDGKYYSYICQLVSTAQPMDFIQYKLDEDNNIVRTTLKDNLNSKLRRTLEEGIAGTLSIVSRQSYNSRVAKYNPEFSNIDTISKNGELISTPTFKFYIPKLNLEVQFNPKAKRSNAFTFLRDGKPIITFNGREDLNNSLEFVRDFILRDFTPESKVLNNYISLNTVNDNIQYDAAITNLLQLSTSIFFNSYFSQELAPKNVDIVTYKKKIESIFGKDNLIAVEKSAIEIGILLPDYTPIMDSVATAYGMTTDAYTSGIVRDGEGNNLSNVGTSMVGLTYRGQWEKQCKKENSATKMFTLLNNPHLHEGMAVSREFRGNEGSKKHIDFNLSESFYTAFVSNYLCNIVGTTPAAFLPSVISDKSQLFHELNNLKQLSGYNKPFSELTKDEWISIANLELGNCYAKIVDNINIGWNNLNTVLSNSDITFALNNPTEFPLLSSIKVIPKFNPFTNFEEVNKVYGDNSRKLLEEVLRVYQQVGGNSLEVSDELHFQGNKRISFNRTLVSLLNRFNPEYFKSKGLDPELVFGKLTNSKDFWDIKESEMLTDLLDNDFIIETTDINGRTLSTPEITYLLKNKAWIKNSTQRVILAKYTKNGKTVEITKWSDLSELGYYSDEGGTHVAGDSGFNLYKFLQISKGKLEINPDLLKYNVTDYLLSQEFVLSTVGTHANHPAKKAVNNPNDLVEEAARYVAQHKRNVSYTAAKQIMQQSLIDGILPRYTAAVIEDAVAPTYNPMGDHDRKGVKIYDGATFASPDTVYLENNSLGGAKVGVDKKPFVHFYKEGTASGGIIKTASFGVTNLVTFNNEFYQRMIKKMWGRNWKNQDGSDFIGNILINFQGNEINFEDSYYKGNDGKYYMINSITYNSDGTYSIVKSEVDKNGTIIKQLPLEITPKAGEAPIETSGITLYPVANNFGLYQMFGGWNSMSKSDIGLVHSEASIRNVVKSINGVATKINEDVLTQEDIYQPLKWSSIQYIVTAGAIKQGAANVNLAHAYNDDLPLLTMEFNTDDLGIQLDAEHSADEATISIMTQVLNGIASRGYTGTQANEVYDAMAALTDAGIEDYIKGFEEYAETEDATKFKDAVVSTIVTSIQNSTSKDGNLMQAIMEDLSDSVNAGKLVTYADVEGKIPFSNPSLFNGLCSAMSSTLTKTAIRLQFNGSLAVLNPSHGIWKLYGDRLFGSFNNKGEIQKLQELYNTKPLRSISEINLGRTYNVTIDGVTTIEFIETPEEYWNLKDRLKDKDFSIIENITAGRDLAAYSFTFKDVEGKLYNMWDLDIVKSLYNVNNPEDKIILRRRLQENLAAISSGRFDTVTIDNKSVQIDKSSLNIKPFELVMPKIYASTFGLTVNDDLNSIKNDEAFFLKRMLKNWDSKVDEKNFDIELKRLDGKHTYLIDSRVYRDTKLVPKAIETRWDGKKLYRVNSDGKKLYRLSDESDSIYTDANGNEVIVTKNTQFFIDAFKYHTLRVSDVTAVSDNIEKILQPIKSSDSKVAKSFVKYLGNGVPADVITYSNKITKESIEALRKNPNAKIEDKIVDNIKDKAAQIHTSFIKSLDVLAARIPAQSMQSFMPMRVVAFDESNTNSAYVNYFQFWLQGSDLDIDKVSLLGYSFNKTGKYVGWSPYFNIQNTKALDASETLPFPTNKELELVETDDTSLTNWAFDFVGSKKLFNFNGSKLIFLPEHDLDNSLNSIQALSKFLRMIKSNGNKLYIPKGSKLPFNKIKEKTDKHNKYIKTSYNQEDMIKNFISSYMFKISSNPINLIQSQSSIDDAVKVFKEIADKSIEGQRNLQYTPGNSVNKCESMYDSQSGKKNVGIVASAIKVFDGLTQYYNMTLRSHNGIKENELLFNRNICGSNFSLLANSYTDSPETIVNERVRQALILVNNDIDAKIVFSGLMTGATDNAKDPWLAKINAGPNMMGLYTYGTAIGIDIHDLAGVMMSNTARIISKLMDSNIFNNKSGLSIVNAIKYLENGPSTDNLDPEFLGILKQELGVGEESTDFVLGKALVYKLKDASNGHDFIHKLNRDIVNMGNDVNKVSLFKFTEELNTYISQVQKVKNDILVNSNGNSYLAITSLKELVQGASEMGRIRVIYALNQGLANKVPDKFKFIDKFESMFNDRIRELSNEDKEADVMINGVSMKVKDVISKLKSLVNNAEEPYRISFMKFMSDEEYRNTLISLYGGIKHSFNVLDAVWSVPHYRGFLKTFYVDVNSNYSIMSKFRMMKDLGPKVISRGRFFNSKDKDNVYKRLPSFCDMTLRNTWLKTSDKVINIPEGMTIMNNLGREFTTKGTTPIMLGTRWGNESFKMWMDTTVIPELQLTEANEFIQGLQPVRINRTTSGNAVFAYTLPTNMLPKSTSEVEILNKYKRAFNQLQSTPAYEGYPLIDLFYYYNLISYNEAPSKNSFNTLFEDIIRTKSCPVMEEFKKFTSLLDANSQLVEGVDYLVDEAIKWCAPFGDTNYSNSSYVRSYNGSNMMYELFKRNPKKRNSDSTENEVEDEDFSEADNSYDNYNDDSPFDEIIDENSIGKVNIYEPNLKDYSIVLEDKTYKNPWDVKTPNNSYQFRIDANSTIKLDVNRNLISIKYKDKVYDKSTLLKLVKDLGGVESDLDIQYVTRVIDGNNVQVVDALQYSGIIAQLFDNPC